MSYWHNERGLSLVEIVVAMLILIVALVPMLDLFDLGTNNYRKAGNETLEINLAQGKMEELLAKDYSTLQPAGLSAYPGFPNYEFKVLVSEYDSTKALKSIIVELYSKDNSQKVVELTTLVAKR